MGQSPGGGMGVADLSLLPQEGVLLRETAAVDLERLLARTESRDQRWLAAQEAHDAVFVVEPVHVRVTLLGDDRPGLEGNGGGIGPQWCSWLCDVGWPGGVGWRAEHGTTTQACPPPPFLLASTHLHNILK